MKEVKTWHISHEETNYLWACLLWGYRVIIPSYLRKQLLDELHGAYLGIVKMNPQAKGNMRQMGIINPNISPKLRHAHKNRKPSKSLKNGHELWSSPKWNPTLCFEMAECVLQSGEPQSWESDLELTIQTYGRNNFIKFFFIKGLYFSSYEISFFSSTKLQISITEIPPVVKCTQFVSFQLLV